MAKAPVPGVVKRMEQSADIDAALSQKVTIARGDQELSFSIGDLGPRDDLACRKATGWNVTELLAVDQIGGLEVLAIWWLARRHNGEPALTYDEVLDEFPTNGDIIAAGFSAAQVDDDTEDDSPEV